MSTRKSKRWDTTKDVKRKSRVLIGQPRETRIEDPSRGKPSKYPKRELWEQIEEEEEIELFE